jgi:hypothetical protein
MELVKKTVASLNQVSYLLTRLLTAIFPNRPDLDTLTFCFGSPSEFGGSWCDCEPYHFLIRWYPCLNKAHACGVVLAAPYSKSLLIVTKLTLFQAA